MGNATATGLIVAAALAVSVGAGVGCTKAHDHHASSPRSASVASSDAPGPNVAAAHSACTGASKASGRSAIRWFHDNYQAAAACAQATNRPLVVDLWAPWCHTCLSMKHTVLQDAGLATMADRFVWLSIDTDKDVNSPVLAKLPVNTWPTFYVVTPAADNTNAVQARYLGAASVKQFRAFLKQGEVGFTATSAQAADGSLPSLLRTADRAAVALAWQQADVAYARVLAKAPANWPRRADVLVSHIGAIFRLGQWDRCVAFGDANLGRTGSSASAGDFIYYASVCAQKSNNKAAAKALRIKAATRLAAVVADANAPLSVDDRSDALRILRTLHNALGDASQAKLVAGKQRALLDDAAKAAANPHAAMTYNWPRAEVYVYLSVPQELVPDLEASVKALPRQYDPPYRLAWIYSKLGKLDKALAMAQQALALAYGPRKARVQSLVANLHAAKGDAAAHVAALEAVVTIYEQLPAGQKQAGALQRARQALANARPR